ncbi:MAG: TonB-dependent receptor [Acidobacteriia bacterium]|nr:TonB-dependent receptor [Terriglobia bacterium]
MESAFRNTWTYFLLPLVVLALLTGTVWAQGTAEIAGLVTDPTGAVVSGTTVTLTNSATGEKRTTVTTGTGNYRFPSLPVVGTYAVSVAPKGFKSTKVQGIVVSVGITVTADLKLELGAASEQVTVEASAETVQTSESAVSQLVDRRIWQQMPLEVRNQNSFIELVAGAVPQDAGSSAASRGASVNGTRTGAGSYLVEGSDNNEQGQAGRGQISPYDKGGAATSISPDAIQEYRVITNSYSAEYGKGGGFITDTVLKSGTNKWHGSLFEYNRIQALAAQDWFSNKAGIKDSLVRNQFGGSIGGPIIKDKTFVYGSAEFHRARTGSPVTATGTTQEFLDFVSSGGLQQWAESTGPYAGTGLCAAWRGASCPGAFALSNTIGPIFTQLRAVPGQNYPVATQDLTNVAGGLFTGVFSEAILGAPLTYPVPVYGTVSTTDPNSFNESRYSVKFDHRFSEKDSVSAVYLFQDGTTLDQFNGGNNTIGPASITKGRGQTAGVTWNHTFTPTLLNTFKVSYLRHALNFPLPGGITTGMPTYSNGIGDMGVDVGVYSGSPQFFTDNQFQYLDTMSLVKGKHNIKFGGEYRRTRNKSEFFLDTAGTVYPYGIESTLTDLAFDDEAETLLFGEHYYGGAYMSAAVDTTTGQFPNVYRGFRANEVAFFVQDDFRVTPRLTVNLGLRWEYFGPPHNVQPGITSNLYFGLPVTPYANSSTNQFFPSTSPFFASVSTASFQVRDNSVWNKDTNNFGPRVGFAFDVFGNQKLVMRAGFGLMYDRIYNNIFENIRFNPPFFSDNGIGPVGPLSTPGLFSYPFTTRDQFNNPLYAPMPNPRHMDQNIVTPYYEQTHFGFQWEFLKGYVFEPEYVGTFGHKLTGFSDINTFNGRTAFGGETAPNCDPNDSTTFAYCRPSLNFGADNFRSNGYASNYHALQLSVRKAYTSGLSFNANYTYSKALDTLSDLFFNRSTNGGRPTDNENHRYDYGPADFDTRHRFLVTFSYDLPFLKENRWLGGWGFNSIFSRQTGHPFSPYSSSTSYDPNKDGYRTDRLVPTVSSQSTVMSGSPGNGYFDTTKWIRYTCPASVNGGLWCDPPIGRGSVIGPGFVNLDLNMTKRFKITERAGFTFSANFFDILNHPNFGLPEVNSSLAATYGRSTATLGDSGGHRITQLALRFDF